MSRRILVTGASVAGNTAAWWLTRFGFEVNVVEKAPAFRKGGQNVDVRGSAREVLRRMDLAYRAAVIALVLEPMCQRDDGSRIAPSSPCEMIPDTPAFEHVRPTAPLGTTSAPRTAPDKAAPAAPMRKLRLLNCPCPIII
jgi:2-polyprenyl-6-methoxyphenol hydroxylase-like FAD-dependent oxidoreductase